MLQHGRITTAVAIAITGLALAPAAGWAQGAQGRADVVQPSTPPLPAARADVVVPSTPPLPSPRADVVAPTHSPQVSLVDLRSPDTRDVADGRGPQTFAPPTVVRIVPTGTGAHGFDWGDAGIGAGGAIALVLLAIGSVMLLTHRRPEHLRSSGPSVLAS